MVNLGEPELTGIRYLEPGRLPQHGYGGISVRPRLASHWLPVRHRQQMTQQPSRADTKEVLECETFG